MKFGLNGEVEALTSMASDFFTQVGTCKIKGFFFFFNFLVCVLKLGFVFLFKIYLDLNSCDF